MEPNTPGLLFPAISLLMLAYTNRFLALANLMRQLIGKQEETPLPAIHRQINNLKIRIDILRYTQGLGVLSLVFCSLSLFFLFFQFLFMAKAFFVAAVVLMILSLLTSLYEIHLSVKSLDIEIAKLEGKE